MLGMLFKTVVQAASKVPWWKVLAMTAGTAAATAAGSKIGENILQDRKKSPKRKIAELEKLKNEGKITDAEFKDLKKKVLESYASS